MSAFLKLTPLVERLRIFLSDSGKNKIMQTIPLHLEISIPNQTLYMKQADEILKTYLISSGKNGVGEIYGSEQTPRGWHVIRAKIGADLPENAVLIKRRWTHEIYTPELGAAFPNRDWILTRIFWLSGLETHKNRLGKVDTMRRYIYIHGTPDSVVLGEPGSRGCIRMHNVDLLDLFETVPVYTKVLIIS